MASKIGSRHRIARDECGSDVKSFFKRNQESTSNGKTINWTRKDDL